MAQQFPDRDLASHLDTAGVGVLGEDLFAGPVRPSSEFVPVQSIFCLEMESVDAGRVFDTLDEVRGPVVEIRVRSDDYQEGYDLIKEIYEVVQSLRLYNPDYLEMVALVSEPNFIELDENNHYHWSLPVEMTHWTNE